MATLIKIDRNGSKHYEGNITCDRCGGQGGSAAWQYTGYTCYKCGGTGTVWGKWIERTPEYEAKLAERRRKRIEARAEEDRARSEEYARAEALRKAEEERAARLEAARKAVSQYVGTIGQKESFIGAFDHSAWYTAHDMFGREETRYIHTFKTPEGNVLVWKTGKGLDHKYGDPFEMTAIVKEHSEYDGEKQTVVKNCKINWINWNA